MKPIVVICTHQRLLITTYNIQKLLRQSVVPHIVLVVSDNEEEAWYRGQFKEITVITHPNRPLGSKWNAGVQQAYKLGADPLIILGSDDILGPKYIENCTKLTSEGHDLIGIYQWFIHHNGLAYFCDYKAKISLGGGRAYSWRFLKKVRGFLFDTFKNRHLDDFGQRQAMNVACNVYDVRDVHAEGLVLHAIKGEWDMINPFNLRHKNIDTLSIHDSRSLLPDLPLWVRSYANDDLA